VRLIARLRDRSFAWAVVGLSVILHVWQLGRRPMAHDEAIDAWFSWQARGLHVTKYNPVYHGPLRFYLEGFVLDHFGTTPGWARLLAVLAGIGATIAIAMSRDLLGRFGAPFAALLFTVSPTVLTVTRTGREDSLTALVSLGVLLIVAQALRAPRARHIVGAAALLATSFTLKETTFIFGLAGACYFVGLGVLAFARPAGAGRRFFADLRRVGTLPWMWAAIAFIGIFMLVFTSFFRYGAGFESGLVDGVKYWWRQHGVGRGSQHWYFYGTIYIGYEWSILAAATIGAVVTVRRRSVVGAWFTTMALVQFALYSWAGEKFAWLALHPLVPTVLLAALGAEAALGRLGGGFWATTAASNGADDTSDADDTDDADDADDTDDVDRDVDADRDRARSRRSSLGPILAATVVTTLLVTLTVVVAVRPAITDGADPRELLVTVQTSDDVRDITDRLADAQHHGRLGAILVDEREGGSWPWAWYLHDLRDVGYQTLDPALPLPDGFDAYIVSASTDPPMVPSGYVIERFPLRVWWLPDYDSMTIGDALRWLTTRRVWSPTASTDQYLIVKATAGVAAVAAATG